MDIEETKIQPIAKRLLSHADWTAIAEAVEHIEDPLFGRNTAKQYAAIQQHLASQACAHATRGLSLFHPAMLPRGFRPPARGRRVWGVQVRTTSDVLPRRVRGSHLLKNRHDRHSRC